MISGYTTFDDTTLEASKEMYNRTKRQAKSIGKKLPKKIKDVYLPKGKLFESRTSEEMYSSSGVNPQFTIEPKMANRWYLKFPKEFNISEWYVKGLTRPSYPFNIGGKITVILRDGVEPSTTENLMKLIETQKPFKLKIEVLDPLAEVIEKWVLKGCVITNVEWSPLDYESKDVSTIYVQISYNEVKFKKK